jgi:hypothetical protein
MLEQLLFLRQHVLTAMGNGLLATETTPLVPHHQYLLELASSLSIEPEKPSSFGNLLQVIDSQIAGLPETEIEDILAYLERVRSPRSMTSTP